MWVRVCSVVAHEGSLWSTHAAEIAQLARFRAATVVVANGKPSKANEEKLRTPVSALQPVTQTPPAQQQGLSSSFVGSHSQGRLI